MGGVVNHRSEGFLVMRRENIKLFCRKLFDYKGLANISFTKPSGRALMLNPAFTAKLSSLCWTHRDDGNKPSRQTWGSHVLPCICRRWVVLVDQILGFLSNRLCILLTTRVCKTNIKCLKSQFLYMDLEKRADEYFQRFSLLYSVLYFRALVATNFNKLQWIKFA